MAAGKEKVGFIFECGPDGADFKVCLHFLARLNAAIEIIPRFMDNKNRLVHGCGEVAAALLEVESCSRIVVMWDLVPAWGGKACRHDDKEKAAASLDNAGVPRNRVLLLCVERELECWLMADSRALATVLAGLKHPHGVGPLRTYRKPDRDIRCACQPPTVRESRTA